MTSSYTNSPSYSGGSTTVAGTVAVSNLPVTQPVTGTVAVSNLPATQPVSGTVAVSSLPAVTGTVTVSNLPVTQPVTGTIAVSNLPATQPVSGTVAVSSLPAVTGTVAVSNLPAIQPTSSIDYYQKVTYSACWTNLSPAASATDIFSLAGTATKTIRVQEITVTASRTTSAQIDLLLIKRSTANVGGGGFVVGTKHDSLSPSSTSAIILYYSTFQPVLGTSAGTLRTQKMFVNAPATGESEAITWKFGNDSSQALVLRGTSELIAVNLNGVTVTGGLFSISITWTEE